MKLKKLWWIAQGVFFCSVKGLLLMLFKSPKEKVYLTKDTWGWENREMHGFPPDADGYVLRADVWLEQTTLSRGGLSHHRTDLLVEWNKLNGQRGAKIMTAFYPVFFLLGVAVALLGSWLM